MQGRLVRYIGCQTDITNDMEVSSLPSILATWHWHERMPEQSSRSHWLSLSLSLSLSRARARAAAAAAAMLPLAQLVRTALWSGRPMLGVDDCPGAYLCARDVPRVQQMIEGSGDVPAATAPDAAVEAQTRDLARSVEARMQAPGNVDLQAAWDNLIGI